MCRRLGGGNRNMWFYYNIQGKARMVSGEGTDDTYKTMKALNA